MTDLRRLLLLDLALSLYDKTLHGLYLLKVLILLLSIVLFLHLFLILNFNAVCPFYLRKSFFRLMILTHLLRHSSSKQRLE